MHPKEHNRGNMREPSKLSWRLALPLSWIASCPFLFLGPLQCHPAPLQQWINPNFQTKTSYARKGKQSWERAGTKQIELNACSASVVDCILSISFSRAFSMLSCTTATVQPKLPDKNELCTRRNTIVGTWGNQANWVECLLCLCRGLHLVHLLF